MNVFLTEKDVSTAEILLSVRLAGVLCMMRAYCYWVRAWRHGGFLIFVILFGFENLSLCEPREVSQCCFDFNIDHCFGIL